MKFNCKHLVQKILQEGNVNLFDIVIRTLFMRLLFEFLARETGQYCPPPYRP